MRLRYEQRRAKLLAVLAHDLPSWRPIVTGDGLYLTILLPDHLDEPALLAAAARRGVGVEGLSLHSYTGDCPPGVVLGHASMAEPAIQRGIELLAEAAGSI
jgi:GntR family transcriptional regulator/MocR family aminotransferase